MTKLTPEQRAARDAHPDAMSPVLRIVATPALVQELRELKARMLHKNTTSGPYRAPEVAYEMADAHGPAVIDALIEQGEVNLWRMSRQSPGYPHGGAIGFDAAISMILQVDGVRLVRP